MVPPKPQNLSDGKRITVRLPTSLAEKLERMAEQNDRTPSAEVRQLVRRAPERKAA